MKWIQALCAPPGLIGLMGYYICKFLHKFFAFCSLKQFNTVNNCKKPFKRKGIVHCFVCCCVLFSIGFGGLSLDFIYVLRFVVFCVLVVGKSDCIKK